MDAPRLGNPRLAYGFRTTLEQVIDLDVHHKRHSLRRYFPSLFHPYLSTLTLQSVTPSPAPMALIGSQRTLREAFFSNPPPPITALPSPRPCHFTPIRTAPSSFSCLAIEAAWSWFWARKSTRLVAHPHSIVMLSRTSHLSLSPLQTLPLLLQNVRSPRVSGSCGWRAKLATRGIPIPACAVL